MPIVLRQQSYFRATGILLLMTCILTGCTEEPSLIENMTGAVSETKSYGIFKTHGISAQILGLIPSPDTGFVFGGNRKSGNGNTSIGLSPGKTYRLVGEFGCDSNPLQSSCQSCAKNGKQKASCETTPLTSAEVRDNLLELQRLGKLIVLKKFLAILKSAKQRADKAKGEINKPYNLVVNAKDSASADDMRKIESLIHKTDKNATNNYNTLKEDFSEQQKSLKAITSQIDSMNINLNTLSDKISANDMLKKQIDILKSLKEINNTLTLFLTFIESNKDTLAKIPADHSEITNKIIEKLNSYIKTIKEKSDEDQYPNIKEEYTTLKTELKTLIKDYNSNPSEASQNDNLLDTKLEPLIKSTLEVMNTQKEKHTAIAFTEFNKANPTPANPLLEPRNWSLHCDNDDDARAPNIWEMEWYSPNSQLSDEVKIRQLEALFEFKLHKAVNNLQKSNVIVFTWVKKSKSNTEFSLLPFASGSGSKTQGNTGYILLDGLRISQLFIGKDFRHNVLKTGATGEFFDSSFMGTTTVQTHGAYLYSELELETEIGASLKITAKDVANIIKGDGSILMELNLAIQSYYASMGVFGNFGNVKQIKWKKMAPNYFNATDPCRSYDQSDGAAGSSHLMGIPYLYDKDAGEFSNTLNTQWHTVYAQGMRIRHLIGVRKDWWSKEECIRTDENALKKGLQVQQEAKKAIALASKQGTCENCQPATPVAAPAVTPVPCTNCDL